jgi:hypothetical protein
LERWQDWQTRAQVRQFFCTPGHTKCWTTSFSVALVPGCNKLCTDWNTWSRRFVPLLLKGVGEGLVIGEDGEVMHFQHMAGMLYGLVDGQQLAIVGAVLLLGRVEFLEKKTNGSQAFLTCCCSTAPMADVETSVTSESGADGSGSASRIARDKLALRSSNA